jgi:hypothetical protein
VTFNFASGDPDGVVPRSPERRSYGLPSEWHAAARMLADDPSKHGVYMYTNAHTSCLIPR